MVLIVRRNLWRVYYIGGTPARGRLRGQVEISVDVRGAAEIPDHIRAFDLPDVPDFVVADVVDAAVAGDEQPFDDFFLFDGFHRRRDVVGPETGQHAAHGIEQPGLLVLA